MSSDLRWALRRLIRHPGASAVFITILGATLAIALSITTVARATIGAALPYDGADDLFSIAESNAEQGIDRMESSYATLVDWSERNRSLASVGAVRTRLNVTLNSVDGVERIASAIVSRSMFETLGVRPTLGRPFTVEEDNVDSGIASVILSHHVWSERLGEDPNVLGTSMVINGTAWEVIGVLPEGRTLAPQARETIDVWLPMGMAGSLVGPPVYDNRAYRMFTMLGRLRSDLRQENLDEDVSVLTATLAVDYPAASEGWTWHAVPLRDRVLEGVTTPIAALWVGALLLFVVAVVNLLALHLQRLRSEQTEVATRLAIGAGTGDIVRLTLMELAMLGLAGGVFGVVLAALAIPAAPVWLPITLPSHVEIAFSWSIGIVAIGMAILSLVVVGFVGTLTSLQRVGRSIAVHGRSAGPGHLATRLARWSLGAQVAATTFLAIGSTVAVKSFAQLASADPGFDTERLMSVRVDAPAELRGSSDLPVTVNEVTRQISSLPQVEDVYVWSPHVPSEATWFTRVQLFDRQDVPESELPSVRINTVSPGAVSGLGLPIVAGRDLTALDRDAGRRVMLISSTAAKQWWGSEADAVGRTMRRWSHEEWSEVVGVVEDTPLSGRQGDGSDFFADVYFLLGQDPQTDFVFLPRVRSGATLTAADLQSAIRGATQDLPSYDVRWMDDRLSDQNAIARSAALLGALFASTAIALAALGLYGGLSSTINSKRREIGLRQALGAPPRRVLGKLVRDGSKEVVAGLVVGITLAWFGLRPMDPSLFQVDSRDAASYGLAAGVMLLTALAALTIPSLRAVRLSPGLTLKGE